MNHHRTGPERWIPLSEAANHLPKRAGKKVHYSTLYRWATKGARGRVLETRMVGGMRFTSLEALERFVEHPVVRSTEDVDDLFDAIQIALDEAGL